MKSLDIEVLNESQIVICKSGQKYIAMMDIYVHDNDLKAKGLNPFRAAKVSADGTTALEAEQALEQKKYLNLGKSVPEPVCTPIHWNLHAHSSRA